ncbi:hypothetical protein M9458_010750, partial [Cirrhinus mrigala]
SLYTAPPFHVLSDTFLSSNYSEIFHVPLVYSCGTSCDYTSSPPPLFPSLSFPLLLLLSPGSVPPTIVQLYQPVRNQDWCIPFTVMGNPRPDLHWYHEGKLLEEQQYIRTEIHEITDTEYHGCLQLVIPTHIHNGIYTLVASNEFGEDRGNVSAHFMHIPDVDHSGT